MNQEKFQRKVAAIVARDQRYRAAAYAFVADAVTYTSKQHETESREVGSRSKHITGRELLEGIREFALKQFGPLTLDVLDDWGVRCTEDLGEIVFAMVDNGLLGATEEDSKGDFQGGYDFRQAFLRPFAAPAEATDEELEKIA
jgi:uncharacterized repeat protein (TIGR04138 family)